MVRGGIEGVSEGLKREGKGGGGEKGGGR